METVEKRVKIQRQTRNAIKDTQIDTGRCSSFRQFLQSAVEGGAPAIKKSLTGQKTTIQLVDHLREIDGIEEDHPGSPVKPRWGNDKLLEAPLSFEIAGKAAEDVTTVAHTTSLSESDVFRAAVFRKLAHSTNALDESEFHSWQPQQFIGKWLSIKKSLTEPRRRLTDILHFWFSRQQDMTIQIVENDLGRFRRFAELYEDEFYGTDCYETIPKLSKHNPLTDVENVIEELTDISFQEGQGGELRIFEAETT